MRHHAVLAFAYKRNNTVYLYADTAVSSHKEPYIKYNSFGQIQTEHEGFYVEEALLKIVKIRDNFVIAYASDDVKASVEMIETIERYYDDVAQHWHYRKNCQKSLAAPFLPIQGS